jgi:hypothetical protein
MYADLTHQALCVALRGRVYLLQHIQHTTGNYSFFCQPHSGSKTGIKTGTLLVGDWGGVRDQSAPTDGRKSLFMCIIVPRWLSRIPILLPDGVFALSG